MRNASNGRGCCCSAWGCPTASCIALHSCPEANGSGSASAGRSINEPALVLADEPTGNLDQKTAETIASLLLEVAAEQHTMLVCVTHSMDLAVRFIRRYELRDGKLELLVADR